LEGAPVDAFRNLEASPMTRRDMLLTTLAAAGAGKTAAAAATFVGQPAAISMDGLHRQRRHARTTFGRIAYLEAGSGEATALFLHGWPLNGFHWRGSLPELAKHRRCVAPDFMGLGYSEVAPSQDLSPLAQTAMIVSLMDSLHIRSAEIVANDSGTAVAQLLVAHHPEKVRSLLLTNGDVHTNSPPEALKPAILAASRGELADMIERHLLEPDFAHSAAGLGGICYTDPTALSPEVMEVYFRPLLANGVRRSQFQRYGTSFEPNPLPEIESRLRRAEVPASIVWGGADVHFGEEWAWWLHRTLPQSRGVRLLPDAKLFFPEERPDVIVEEALRLWHGG
jgi:haloalkane dehalogenase